MIIIKTKPGKEYFRQLKTRYRKSSKKGKKVILDEFTQTTGYHRKHAIDLLRGSYKQHKGESHRPHRIYTKEDTDILEKAYELLGWICSKRMKPSLRLAVDELVKAGKISLSKDDRKRIIGVSPATIDRLFKKHKKRPKLRQKLY